MLRLTLTALILTACAPTLPVQLNTTKWAIATEQVFASPRPSNCDGLRPFQALRDAQAAITPTNLVLRHDVAMAGCRDNPTLYARSWRTLRLMSRNGYWPEGYSYYAYTKAAFLWYNGGEVYDLFTEIDANYARLIASDGSIPIPETSDERFPLEPHEAYYQDGVYLVKRWQSGGHDNYLLIDLNTDPDRLNFHSKPSFGYYAYWRDGKWIHRVAPYTGYQPDEILHEQRDLGVPLGPWSVPTWRIDGSWKMKVLEVGLAAVRVEYLAGSVRVERVFEIGDSVIIADIVKSP